MPDNEGLSQYTGWRDSVFISIFTPLLFFVVALRFYSRALTGSRHDLGDLLIVLALLSQILVTGLSIGVLVQGGVGYHYEYLMETSPGKVTVFYKYLLALSVEYFATITITKLAVCRLYRALFPQKIVHRVLDITTAVLIASPLATSIALLAACRPFSANWGSLETQAAHCFDKEALFVWGSVPNISTDIILLVLPLPIVWELHATKTIKVALTVTFVIGSAGLVASILRFVSFLHTNAFTDPTFNAVELIIWTVAEPGIYLISACCLVLRPVLDKFFQKSRTGAAASHAHALRRATASSRAGTNRTVLEAFEGSGGRNIAGRGANTGFFQLSDTENETQTQSSENRIVVTTDIQQDWHEL